MADRRTRALGLPGKELKMTPEIRNKMKEAVKNFVEDDATDFELTWIYHRIFHERSAITAEPPECEKCRTLQE